MLIRNTDFLVNAPFPKKGNWKEPVSVVPWKLPLQVDVPRTFPLICYIKFKVISASPRYLPYSAIPISSLPSRVGTDKNLLWTYEVPYSIPGLLHCSQVIYHWATFSPPLHQTLAQPARAYRYLVSVPNFKTCDRWSSLRGWWRRQWPTSSPSWRRSGRLASPTWARPWSTR